MKIVGKDICACSSPVSTHCRDLDQQKNNLMIINVYFYPAKQEASGLKC